MTLPTNTFTEFAAVGVREDLLDAIFNISPYDTPFMTLCEKARARQQYHEWQTDILRAVNTSNAQLAGDDITGDSRAATTRIGNYCQISRVAVTVDGTLEAVDKAGRKSEMAYQMAKGAKELKRDMEAILTQNQASAAGSVSAARNVGSLESWLVTNTNRGTSGANGGFSSGTTAAATDGTQRALTEDLVKGVLQTIFTNGGDPEVIMVGPFNKRAFSALSGGANKFVRAEDKKLVAAVDVYVSDYGELKVIPNRFQRDRSLFILQPDMAAIAFLRPFKTIDLAKTGDSEKKAIIAEYTLEMRNEKAHGVVADLLTS